MACRRERLARSLSAIALGAYAIQLELMVDQAKAELARQFCHAKGTSRGANIRRHDWPSASRDPRLRGRFVTRCVFVCLAPAARIPLQMNIRLMRRKPGLVIFKYSFLMI